LQPLNFSYSFRNFDRGFLRKIKREKIDFKLFALELYFYINDGVIENHDAYDLNDEKFNEYNNDDLFENS